MRQLQAEQLVIGGQHEQAQLLGDAGADPFIAAAAQGGGRAGAVSDPAVAAAEDQDLDELVEHDPVRDAGPVAAQRMVDLTSREECGDLDPEGFQDRRWEGRHETSAWSQGVRASDHHGSCLPCSTSPYWRMLLEAAPVGGYG